MKQLVSTISKIALLGLIANCGVEAGNPDSSEEKPAKFSLKLTETQTTGLNHFYMDIKSITIGNNSTIELDETTTIDILTLENGKTATVVDQLNLTSGELQQIVIELADTDQPVRAVSSDNVEQKVVVLSDEQKTDSLLFTGSITLSPNQDVTAIVDVDLRYTLSGLDENRRNQLGVNSDVVYALNHQHTFFQEDSRATVNFSGKTSGELLCITETGSYTASNLPQSCIPNGGNILKGVYADSEGNAVVISIPPGIYDIWGIMEGKVTKYNQTIEMNGGDIITID